ncbi:HEXXH motif domain-containing protein [Lentzea cavernae]|uniref:HEXXH motif domain-containing protein n=1 Tax=Lentzea cavernae TaxID=2020703 RepID=A0ABQ3MFQ2_9PSEU|nr:HEXXH motif domain-containing protein [Lentzea cavernae]
MIPFRGSVTRGGARPAGVATHRLSRFVFDEICHGSVSRAGIDVLRGGQYSIRKLRLRTFVDAAAEMADRLGPLFDVERAWDLLAEAESVSPAAVEDVLMYPTVGVWLSRALRQVLGMALDDTPFWSEVGGFQLVAAAAAVRSGVLFEIAVPVVHGAVTLPSVGVLRPATRVPVGHAVLCNTPAGLSLTVQGMSERSALEPVKRHRGVARGQTVELVLDDLDPYREFTAPLPACPLSDHEIAEWRKLVDEAWDLLTACHPKSVEELSSCITSVVPLSADQQVFAASSTAAFGSIAMSPKRTAVEFAEALLHEIQHSKVNALLDLVMLCEDDDECRFYAPWLDYPRPLTGLLHGIYAFTTVVEFWYVQRELVPTHLVRSAHFNFAYRHRQVGEVVRTLRRTPQLTELGRRFVAAVSLRLAACPPAGVPADVVDSVETITSEHRVLWRLRHVRPDPDVVEALAEAWLDRRAPTSDFGADVVFMSPGTGRSPLGTFLKASMADHGVTGRRFVDEAEDAFLNGDAPLAAQGFAARLTTSPEDVTAWSGLAVTSGSATLARRPEVVRAVHRAVAGRTGTAPDPGALAVWLDQTAS